MMLKDLMKCVREYKKASLQAPVLVSLEVVMECIIPFIISKLVNEIKAGLRDQNNIPRISVISV